MNHNEARPVIGINCAVNAGGPGEKPALMVRTTYVDAVINSGGLPVLLPAIEQLEIVEKYADLCDGFIFVGGPDLPAARYGDEENHPTVVCVQPRRENFDFALIEAVHARQKPFLGVCLGCQEVNVFLGGTLIQDIASEFDGDVSHNQRHAPYFARQEVEVLPETLLSELTGSGRINANTAHHQAIRKPGKGLKISALSPDDGIIEACELTDYPFGLAIQWHPEVIAGENTHKGIFDGLVAAAGGTADSLLIK